MPKKIDVNKVAEILKRKDLEPALLREVVEEMNQQVQPEVDEEKTPALKKQFAILISDPDNRLPEGNDFVGWIIQLPENESVLSAQERIFKATYDFNTTKKGRLHPAKTVGEAIEHIPAKHFKETGVFIKTKVPVLMLRTDNEIPTDQAKGKDARRGRMD
jgi:hypothetical protein